MVGFIGGEGMSNTTNLFDKPVEEMTGQELNMFLSLTEDAVFDLNIELKFLRERHEVLLDEINRRRRGITIGGDL